LHDRPTLISQAEALLHGALLRVESGDESVVPELSNIKVAIGRPVIAATPPRRNDPAVTQPDHAE